MNSWKKWPIKTIHKKDFPRQLQIIKNCPEKLFYRGNWDNKIFEKSLAVVGSRRMSRYGQEIIAKFMPELMVEKITIISGFMYGVDTEAHQKCLDCNGITVAVLGGGLNILTPIENEKLYIEILENNGLIISEYESNFQPTLWSFPQRNRIVAGLSTMGALIIEAGMKSGSLITARLAREQGKNVYAIPGQINNPIAMGTNYLIKEGQGKIITQVEDVLNKKKIVLQDDLFISSDPLERKIIQLLQVEPLTIDEMCLKLHNSAMKVNSKISIMALNNLIYEDNGKIYLKK